MAEEQNPGWPRWLKILKSILETIIQILNNLPPKPSPEEMSAVNRCLKNFLTIIEDLKSDADNHE